MTNVHLTEDELDAALLGEPLSEQAEEHLGACLVCRRRRDEFFAVVAAARGADPDPATRERVRERALAAVATKRRRHWAGWLAAAAAVILLAVLPLVATRHTTRPQINADRVLTEVDTILNRDPLEAMAPADVVEAVVPVSADTGERSAS
jgi:predicted anti-sigma-YlaC factor YlaD